VKFGITFGQLNPRYFLDAALAADTLGYESVWMPEHLVFPLEVRGQLVPGEEHPPVPPDVPIFDAPAYLSYVAGRTEHVRLGTFVYLLALRHPYIPARAFTTLDIVSGGRAELGVGAGWLETEWEALGLDPRTRGRRLDESLVVLKRLWTDEVVEHHGQFWDLPPAMFEPKPVQRPHPPILIGGESDRALQRAADHGDGWLAMFHTPGSIAPRVARLTELLHARGRSRGEITVTCIGQVDQRADVERWQEAGVDRLIVVPWRRGREAVEAMERFAEMAWG
jgi:probable F420-dependent oxidoreductase